MDEELDLNKRQQRAADFLSLQEALSGTSYGVSSRRAKKAQALLERGGIDVAAATEAGNYGDVLRRQAEGGALGGKRSKLRQTAIAGKEIEREGDLAKSRGEEDIARAYANMQETFTSGLGTDAGLDSPAMLAAIARYQEGRASDTTRYLGEIERRTSDRQIANMNQIASVLDETGALIESLKMLDDEKRAYRRAFYVNTALAGINTTANVISSLSGGGGGDTPQVQSAAPRGDIASWHSAMFPG